MTPEAYQRFVSARAKKSPIVRDTALAFVIGGGICVLGQLIQNGWIDAGLSRQDAGNGYLLLPGGTVGPLNGIEPL